MKPRPLVHINALATAGFLFPESGILSYDKDMNIKLKNSFWLSVMILILIPVSVSAADKWTKNQITLQAIATTLIVIDWGQTLDVSENPDEYQESNLFLDEHPSRSQVNRHMATAAILQLAISYLLPSKYRIGWLTGIIIVEAGVVAHNYHIGLRVNF